VLYFTVDCASIYYFCRHLASEGIVSLGVMLCVCVSTLVLTVKVMRCIWCSLVHLFIAVIGVSCIKDIKHSTCKSLAFLIVSMAHKVTVLWLD